jgi:hypothetical protein
MDEDVSPDAAPEPVGSPALRPEPARTGVPGVDEVIAAVEELEERPLEEHVGVFEAAHDQLRRALDAHEPSGDQQPPA